MASIEKARTKRGGYVVRYRGPDRKARTKTFARKIDAQMFLRTIDTDIVRGEWIDPNKGRVTVAEFGARYWSTTVNLRPSTRIRDDATWRNHILPTFGAVPLARVEHLDVQQWVAGLSGSGLAAGTVQKALQVLAKVMRAAVKGGLVRVNPCAEIDLPKVERREMRFCDPTEIARLADAIDPRYRALIMLGAYGGLRKGEMFGLKRPRVDLMRGTVDIAETVINVNGRQYWGPPKTRAGRRTVPVPRFVCDELQTHIGERALGPDGLVFTSPNGEVIRANTFHYRFWVPALRAAELDGLRFHDLRHTAVSLWIATGASPKEIAARAGHTSVATVLDRYGHLYPGHEHDVNERLDALARDAAKARTDGTVLALPRDKRAMNR